MTAINQPSILDLRNFDLDSPSGRPLIRGLNLSLAAGDRVALVGRNGVGKSSLLAHLARAEVSSRGGPGVAHVPQHPELERARSAVRGLERQALRSRGLAAALEGELQPLGLCCLPTLSERPALSRGEQRKLELLAAKHSPATLLLLDEPTQDLDEAGVKWLLTWLPRWSGALIVASHSPRLLGCFEHFFVLAESGCRHLPGDFRELEARLEREARADQRRHVARLNALEQRERHHVAVSRRRQRKKKLGRLHELRRRSSRSRLNEKRSYAQESQARAAKVRTDRIEATRDWAKATRRALRVDLHLEGLVEAAARLPPDDGRPAIELECVGLERGGSSLVECLSLKLGRERIALTGPNGCGKTSLLQTMLGELQPTRGRARRRLARLGAIAQGARDWMGQASLVERLYDSSHATSLDELASLLLAHRFPLALAQRAMASLSPGERVRAALICLFHRDPAVELLVLDEPSFSLDFVGLTALTASLRAWPGGLIVASHDSEFLAGLDLDFELAL